MAKVSLTSDGTLLWYCPGCKGGHGVPVIGARKWTWNDSLESPTLSPSVRVLPSTVQPLCHIFMCDGRIQFLPDCSHALAGQTVDMPEWGA